MSAPGNKRPGRVRGRKTKEIKAKIPLKQPLTVSESASTDTSEKIIDGRSAQQRSRLKTEDSGFISRTEQRDKPNTAKYTSAVKRIDNSDKDETANTTDFEVKLRTLHVT